MKKKKKTTTLPFSTFLSRWTSAGKWPASAQHAPRTHERTRRLEAALIATFAGAETTAAEDWTRQTGGGGSEWNKKTKREKEVGVGGKRVAPRADL